MRTQSQLHKDTNITGGAANKVEPVTMEGVECVCSNGTPDVRCKGLGTVAYKIRD